MWQCRGQRQQLPWWGRFSVIRLLLTTSPRLPTISEPGDTAMFLQLAGNSALEELGSIRLPAIPKPPLLLIAAGVVVVFLLVLRAVFAASSASKNVNGESRMRFRHFWWRTRAEPSPSETGLGSKAKTLEWSMSQQPVPIPPSLINSPS